MSNRPTVAIVPLETIERILTAINNPHVMPGLAGQAVRAVRDALTADGVIKRDEYGGCALSDFYAERGDNVQ